MIMPVRLRWYGLVRFGFWKFHVVVVQNNGKEMYKKSVLHVLFCSLDLLFFFFTVLVAFDSPLSITRFYILFEQSITIIENFAFALAKSIYFL